MTEQTALFPIGTISEQTGVNTVTLRAWERRYGLLKPHRTPKGHRLYTQEDIERVKQVLLLLEQGVPVSRVREVLDKNKSRSPILRTVQDIQTDDPWRHYHNIFQRCIRKLDTRALEHTFNEVVAIYSLDMVGRKILLPMYKQLHEQSTILSSTAPNYAFLHDFLCAKLGCTYLHAISNANGKRILLLNTQDNSMLVETLLFAAILSQHNYHISLLGNGINLDHIPLMLERNTFDALIIVDLNPCYMPLQVLADISRIPVFLYPETTQACHIPLETTIYQLPAEMGASLEVVDDILGSASPKVMSNDDPDMGVIAQLATRTLFKR